GRLSSMSNKITKSLVYFVSLITLLLGQSAFAAYIHHDMTALGDQVNFNSGGDLSAVAYVPTTSEGSGSGVFPSFLKLGSINKNSPYKGAPYNGGVTEGYNSNNIDRNGDMYQDANNSATHTHALLLADIPTVKIGNRDYIEVLLDVNEPNGGDPFLAINDIRLYSHEDPTLSGYDDAAKTLGGVTAAWDMDGYGDDHDLLLDYSHYSGSGNPDMVLLIDSSLFTGGDYVSLFMRAGIENINNQGDHESGFEEWGIGADGVPFTITPPKAVPVPASALLFGSALLGFMGLRRRLSRTA
ncbi:MAG: PEP-CTERM sorting domain-containing protein, partial [Candidatus Sedimenticola sp. (ex Thyasira tokunagai)]